MPTSFNIGIDWRRKGLICWDARPGDALNLVPSPLTYSVIGYRMPGALGGALVTAYSPWGIRTFNVSVGSGLSDGLIVGQDASLVVDDIPVLPSTTYSVGVRVLSAPNFNNVPLILRVKNQAGTTLFSSSVVNTISGWVQITATGATNAATTHFYVELVKNNSAISGDISVTGFMIVQNATLPNGYNAGSAADLYDNVTAWTTDAEWFLGIHRPYQDDADDSMLRLRLKNADKTFSPEYAGSPLYGVLAPYRPAVVRSNDGTTTRTHWTGWIESIQPSPDQYGERTVEIRAAGPMLFLEDVETSLEVQENKRTDEIIDALLDEVEIPPALSESWLLGVAGYGEINGTAHLADTVLPHALEAGKTTLAYAADNWVRPRNPGESTLESFNVYRAIKDVVSAERGRFFFDREGRAQFWNRHHLLLDTTVKATFDNAMIDIAYEYAGLGEFKNEIVVTCHPRTVSAGDNDLLWTLEQPLTINAGETRSLNASYRDESENRIGGKDVRLTNVTFSEGSADVRLVAGGNRATLEITNNAAAPSNSSDNGGTKAVLATAELRGTKITSFGQMDATAHDLTSAAFYGRRVMRMNLASIDRLDDAQTIADFELGRRAQPSGKVSTIKVVSDAKQGGSQHAEQLERTIGDLITVKEAQTAHDEQYFIIGEEHRLTQRGEVLETTWYLEPAAEGQWWLLCDDGNPQFPCGDTRSRLDNTTRLAY